MQMTFANFSKLLAFQVLAQRRLQYNFLFSLPSSDSSDSSTLYMLLKFDPKDSKIVYVRFTRGRAVVTAALATKIGFLGLSPKTPTLVMISPKQPVTGKV